jgi:hypothetical protein
MVLEKEVNVQTFDEQMSEIHTAEHRVATISVAGEHAGIDKASLPAQVGVTASADALGGDGGAS